MKGRILSELSIISFLEQDLIDRDCYREGYWPIDNFFFLFLSTRVSDSKISRTLLFSQYASSLMLENVGGKKFSRERRKWRSGASDVDR